MNRFFANEIQDDIASFTKEDSLHMIKVLRLEEDEKIEVVNNGQLYLAKMLKSEDKKNALAKITNKISNDSEPKVKVTLFQGLPKGAKMEFIIQKCVELGIYEIIPFTSTRCVVKPKDNKIDRLNKIALEACKQCKRVFVPKVKDVIDIKNMNFSEYDLVLVAYEEEKALSIKTALTENEFNNIAIIIGPEGGFDFKEINDFIQKNVKAISLGKRILRTETAGMAMLSCVLYESGDMNA